MVSRILDYFSIKHFPDDEKDRKNRILHILWVSYWILYSTLLILGLILSRNKIGVVITCLITLIFLFVIGLVKNKGYIKEASALLVSFSWITIILFSFLAGGPFTILSSYFIALIIITGILLGFRSAITVLIASSVAGLTYLIINDNYYEFPILFKPHAYNEWLLFTIIAIFVLIPIFLDLTTLENSLQSAHENSLKYKNLSETLDEKVNERTIELEDTNRNLKFFTYAITHDFHSTILKIENYSSLIETQYSNQFNNESLDMIKKIKLNSRQIHDIFEDLMEFFKLIQMPLSKSNVDMNELVNNSLNLFSDEIKQRNIKIVNNKLDSCQGDPTLLFHVWTNLISNSIKYSRNQNAPQIELGQNSNFSGITYYVKDNGVGFDMKICSKLFNEFERFRDDFEGTGLGLALCKRIIEGHGGKIGLNQK